MGKKDKLLLVSKIQKIVGFMLLIICVLLPFAPAITLISGSMSKTYGMAYSFFFSGNIKTLNITYKIQNISILGFLGILLLILSLILIMASFAIHKKKVMFSKWLLFFSAIMILISAIMFSCSHRSISNVLADALISSHSDTVSQTIFENTKLEFGVFGIAIFGFISSFSLLASLIFDGTLDKVRARLGIN